MQNYKDKNGGVHALDSDEFEYLLPLGCVKISQAEADVLLAPTAAQLWTAYQAQAQAALDKSDVTIIRCAESNVRVPAEWTAYRKSLRSIIAAYKGDPAKPLPVRPEYPEGT